MASVSKRQWTHKGVTKEAWTVRYFDEKGVRRSKQFDQKKTADGFKRKVERETEDGTHVPDGDTMTVKQASVMWLQHQEQRLTNGQIGRDRLKKLESSVRRCLVPIAGHVPLNKMTMGHVERMFVEMQTRDGIQPITARERIYELKMFQDYAIKRKWMRTRPVDEALEEMRGIRKAVRRVPTEAEVRRLLDVVAVRKFNGTARSQARLECMVHLAVFCGLRQGEILGLPVDRIRLDKGVIEVRHSLLHDDILKGPKTVSGIRDVRLPPHLAAMLKSYVERFYADGPRNPNRLTFRTHKGCQFDKATVHKQWHDLIARAGISEEEGSLTFHALRHFCASWIQQKGVPAAEAARFLGHSKVDTTLQIYTHALMTEEARALVFDGTAALLTTATDATVTQHPLSA